MSSRNAAFSLVAVFLIFGPSPVLSRDHEDVSEGLMDRASHFLSALTAEQDGDLAESEKQFRLALEDQEDARNPYGIDMVLEGLAGICLAQGEYTEAETFYQRALANSEKAHGDEGDVVRLLSGLIACYVGQDKLAEAEPLARRCLAYWEKGGGPMNSAAAPAFNNLAKVLFLQGKFAEAEPLYRRAMEVRPDDPKILENVAALLRKSGRAGEAGKIEDHALAIRVEQAEKRVKTLEAAVEDFETLSKSAIQSFKDKPNVPRLSEAEIRSWSIANKRSLARSLKDHAALLRKAGRVSEAERHEARAESLLKGTR